MILCSIANRGGKFLSALFVIRVVRIWRDHHFHNAANTCPLSQWNFVFIYELHFLLLYRMHYLANVQYFLILRYFLSFRLLTTRHICITSYKLCLFEEFVLLPDRGHKWMRYDTLGLCLLTFYGGTFSKYCRLVEALFTNQYLIFISILFVCLFGTKMVVRAVAAVLTAEEQAMNPTPHPRQRRTRPGDWTYSEKEIW